MKIKETIDNYKLLVINWAKEKSRSAQARYWLFIAAFTEASISPLPPEAVLVPLLLANAKRWYSDILLTATASVMGGVLTYFIGLWFFDTFGSALIDFYGLEGDLEKIAGFYQNNSFWTTFIAAFTPIPYRLFALAAGLFSVNLAVFIIASFIGRGLRYFLVGYIMHRYGTTIGDLMFRHFNLSALIIGLLVLLYIFIKF